MEASSTQTRSQQQQNVITSQHWIACQCEKIPCLWRESWMVTVLVARVYVNDIVLKHDNQSKSETSASARCDEVTWPCQSSVLPVILTVEAVQLHTSDVQGCVATLTRFHGKSGTHKTVKRFFYDRSTITRLNFMDSQSATDVVQYPS